MLRNSKVLVLVVAAAGLAACATKPQRAESRDTRAVVQAPRRDAGTNVAVHVERDTPYVAPMSSTYDYSRRTDCQSVLNARLDSIGREIASLRSASAPRSDCERRMRYLEAVRDSAREHVASLAEVGADQWVDKSADAEEKVSTLETYLSKDRADCVTGSTASGTR